MNKESHRPLIAMAIKQKSQRIALLDHTISLSLSFKAAQIGK